MKTTIEKINGKLCTVIWHVPPLDIDELPTYAFVNCGVILFYGGSDLEYEPSHVATALPALPRHLTEKDAALLYRYMAEGIFPHAFTPSEIVGQNIVSYTQTVNTGSECQITHATDAEGNEIEVAIEEDE